MKCELLRSPMISYRSLLYNTTVLYDRGSPLSEVQNVFVTLVGTKIFVLTMEVNVFSNVFSFRWGYLHMNM